MSQPTKIIKIANLRVQYGDFVAVDDVSFSVKTGELFAFLGPNGAGKSTVISVLTTINKPASGHIAINNHALGKDNNKIREAIGVVYQDSLLDPQFSVRENLAIRAELYGMSRNKIDQRISDIAQAIELNEFLDRPYGNLSGGQKRRADIARALLSSPRILFLDEPTTGLDPQSRNLVWQTIEQLRGEMNLTIFLTTHYMEEAERADDVVVIDHGRIIASATPAELRRKFSRNHLKITATKPDEITKELRARKMKFSTTNNLFDIDVKDALTAKKCLDEFAKSYEDFEFIHGSMDDVFLNLTGREIRGDNNRSKK
jgi:multidrug/hemolysin transport system ATP-binding protein